MKAPLTPRYDGYLIDLDGVVWLAREPIAGSIEAICSLREAAPVHFVTNDPRSSRDALASRLTELGAPTEAREISTSASATADAIAREHPGARVMTAGASALEQELADLGLEIVADDQASDEGPGVVAIGGGSNFDFELVARVHAAVRGGAELWATNKDPVYPTPSGLTPGTGAFVAAVEYAAGREARSVGKPHPGIFAAAAEAIGAARAVMIGDSLESDVAGAAAAGLATAAVLTGRADHAAIRRADPQPDHVFDDLRAAATALAGG